MKMDRIADLLSDRRKELNVSQSQLSDICGVSVHTLSNIEAGVGNPTIGCLMKVIDALGMNLDLSIKQGV